MKKVLLFMFLISSSKIYSQLICVMSDEQQSSGIVGEDYLSSPKSISSTKIVRVNFQFISKNDFSGNFSPTGDGNGNTYDGYQHARALIDYINNSLQQNIPMNIPPGNNIPVLNQNYKFVLDGVYFRNNTSEYNFNLGQKYNLYGEEKPNVFNVFLTTGGSGYASNVSLTSSTKWVISGMVYDWYAADDGWIAQGGAVPVPFWALWQTGTHISHELGHLLGLSHTVRYNDGPICPDMGTSSCGDDCMDTPAAIHMVSVLNAPYHPACGFNTGSTPWCSNNLMDYSGYKALTPCQIEKIHLGLENGLNPYTTCYAVSIDKSICDLGYPKLAHFGKNITIGGCSNPPFALEGNEKVDIYFSNSVEFFTTELAGNSELEVIYEPTCNF